MKTAFGKYRIISEIGSGSAAMVYSAQADSEPVVALKVFFPEEDDDWKPSVQRFFGRDLDGLRSLSHPNIVKYLDAGVVDERPYIAMELFRGGSLGARIRRSTVLDTEDVVSILEPIANALDYTHQRRILHRDIKPSNILFGDDGRPGLSDFGIAHVFFPREEVSTIQFSGALFTTDFAAPEVLEEAPPSRLSDIYSLGITAYFALSGQSPSKGNTIFARARDRVAGRIIPLSERNPAVPAEVSRVVMKAIAPDPKDRFQSAREFAGALRMGISAPLAGATSISAASLDESLKKRSDTPLGDGEKKQWLDYWRYVIVPVVIAIVGAVAAWLARK